MQKVLVVAVSFSCAVVLAEDLRAEPGVFGNEVRFGQSAAFEGPASELGQGMRNGILAAFQEINQAGGINGRRLSLTSYDDGYDPNRAIENTRKLIDQDEVFALLGGVGTPTAKVIQPISSERDVPFVGPFTGASFLRDPGLRNVVNIRASYEQETEAWIERLTEDLGISRVAVFYQDDSFGRAGLKGVNNALKKRNLEIVAEGKYMRNTAAVKRALLSIREGKPEAVAMIGAYKASAEFIRLARSLGMDIVFLNISFVGSKALSRELDGQGKGVFVTQVVPFPEDEGLEIVKDYQRAMKEYDPAAETGFVSLEGYIVGRFVGEVLKELGDSPTRSTFLDQIDKTKSYNLGGLNLIFGSSDNQGLDRVFLTEILPDGRFRSIERLPK